MSALTTTPSLQVLKNRGIPVLVHAVQADPNGVRYNRVYTSDDENGEPVFETAFIRLTALSMAEIEGKWVDPTPYVTEEVIVGGKREERSRPAVDGEVGAPRDPMEVWEDALSEKPYQTIIATLAIVWECTPQEAGKRIKDDAVDEYSTAIGAAVLMANGVEGDAVVRLLKTGVSSSKRLKDEVAAAAAKAVTELEAEEAQAESLAAADDTPTSLNPDPGPSSLTSASTGANSAAPLMSSGV